MTINIRSKYLVILSFVAIFGLAGCTRASTLNTNMQETEQTNDSIVAVYYIDNEEVTQKEYERFLAKLEELPQTWYCAEINTGGITGYDAKDKKGVLFEVKVESDSGKSKNYISKKLVP